jgi:hypothetical protein
MRRHLGVLDLPLREFETALDYCGFALVEESKNGQTPAPTCKVRSLPFAVTGVAMQKLVSGFLAGTALGFAMISVATAADCRRIRHCTREGCITRHVCLRSSCPDRYSCSPLFGAYGPYGGEAYWRAYTATGWDP